MAKSHQFQLAQRVRHTDGRLGTITRVATAVPDVVRVRWGTNDTFEWGDGDESVNVKHLIDEQTFAAQVALSNRLIDEVIAEEKMEDAQDTLMPLVLL